MGAHLVQNSPVGPQGARSEGGVIDVGEESAPAGRRRRPGRGTSRPNDRRQDCGSSDDQYASGLYVAVTQCSRSRPGLAPA